VKNEVGVIQSLRESGPGLSRVKAFGVKVCQLCSWNPALWTDSMAEIVKKDMRETKIGVTAFWTGYTGPSVWNFTEGPATLGLTPAAHRKSRVAELKKGADFAKKIGVPAIITHLGFIPENPADPDFKGVVDAVREIAEHCKKLGLEFWFETGQETPVTLLRLIETVGTGNLGVNLDPANLILYGKGNPIDSLDVFGKYVKNIHAKDGFYPTDPMKLGREVKVGEGRVRFPDFVRRLAEIGFKGEHIIEREIQEGEQQNKEIAETVDYLRKLIKEARA
jgi:sugar phosphate isomerase/epimerase